MDSFDDDGVEIKWTLDSIGAYDDEKKLIADVNKYLSDNPNKIREDLRAFAIPLNGGLHSVSLNWNDMNDES
ncbi:hypothetical protein [Pseudobutyrivibrio sp.]